MIVEALAANKVKYCAAAEVTQSEMTTIGWNKSALLLIEGTTIIFAQWIHSFSNDHHIPLMFDELLDHLNIYLGRQSLSLSQKAFMGLTKVLSEIDDPSSSIRPLISKSRQIWQPAKPIGYIDDSARSSGNQEALLAYLDCLSQILRLEGDRLEQTDIKVVLAILEDCVTQSTTTAYTSDVDQLTPVQKAVIESLKSTPTRTPGAAFDLLECIAFLITLAYKPKDDWVETKQSYLALSKASMSLLDAFITIHLKEPDIDFSKFLTTALAALNEPMHLKYQLRLAGKPPLPWRKSISTATAILDKSRSLIEVPEHASTLNASFWDTLVNTIDGILSADCNATNDNTQILDDESADITAFSQLRIMMISVLGYPFITDSTRNSFAATIFQNSLLHEPHPDDLAGPGEDLLSNLESSHIGRVQELPPSPRSTLCYILLDDLFVLVTSHKVDDHPSPSSTARIVLAQAITPHLLLRCGLTLKSYIADQPLRGLLPQPWSQKEEMLHILRKLIELDSEPLAIPASRGIVSEHKRHLYRLYPLLVKALQVARRDDQMTTALREVLTIVGKDMSGGIERESCS